MPNIVVGLGNEIIGVDNFDIYISDCTSQPVFVTGLTFSDFPYTFNSDPYITYDCCYQYFISGETGCVCTDVVNACSPTPTPTNTITPTVTLSPGISQSPTATPTNTPTFTQTQTNTPTLTNTSTHTPTSTSTLTPTPSITLSITPSPNSSPTITPTNTVTQTPTPTVTPTQRVFWVSLSGCCTNVQFSALFDFSSSVSVGTTFYWSGNQQYPAQCYTITAVNPSIAGTPLAVISTLYSNCPDCTTANVCVSPTPTITQTPTVTPTLTKTPTNTPTPTSSPTNGYVVRRVNPCCNPTNTNNFMLVAPGLNVGDVVVGSDSQCYQLGVTVLNQNPNVTFSGMSNTDCPGCLVTYPCQTTPTPTPTSTPSYYFKLTTCCDYDGSVTINDTVVSYPFFASNQWWILDGVVYQLEGPFLGSSNWNPGDVVGSYGSCQEALSSPNAYEQCLPEPTPEPECDCKKGIPVTYECVPTSQTSFCPPVTIQYTNCDTNESEQFQLSAGQEVSIAECAIVDTVICISNLNEAQIVSIDTHAGTCCGSENPDGYVLWRLRHCINGSTAYALAPNTLSAGQYIRTTDSSCWLLVQIDNQEPTHTFLTVDNSCCS